MIEIFRRAAALILICLGGYLMLWPGGRLLIVSPQTTQEIQGRAISVSEPQWSILLAALEKPMQHPELKERIVNLRSKKYIFKQDEAPFDEIGHYPEQAVYISINNGRNHLRVYASHAGDIYGLPDQYKYPYFYYGIICILAGFILYFIIPRRQYAKEELHYPRGAAVTGPDMMGLIMTPLFFLLPFPIVGEMNPQADILSITEGWIWLTGAMWFMAAISAVLLLTALKYSDLSYRITDRGFHIAKMGRERFIEWKEIEYYKNYRTRLSGRLSTLLLIFGSGLQAVAAGLMLRHREEWGIIIQPSNGKGIKIMGNELDGFDAIVHALKSNRVKRKTADLYYIFRLTGFNCPDLLTQSIYPGNI